jgi:hypothetical protein
MLLDLDVDDADEEVWYQPVVAFGVPNPEVAATSLHDEQSPDQQIATGIRAIHANAAVASSGSYSP